MTKIYRFLSFLFILILFSPIISAQKYQPYKQQNTCTYCGYQFEIFPGTEAWKALDMNAHKHALLQIPDDTLAAISTQRLVETCLYYPMIMDVFAFDNQIQGFNFIKEKFNGFGELFKREDAGFCLIFYYMQRNATSITRFEESVDRGRYSFDFVLLELIMSQPEIMLQLNSIQLQQLTSNILEKLEQQSVLSQYYSRVFIPVSAFVTGKILLQAGALPKEMRSGSFKQFMERGILESPEDITLIFQQAQIFTNKNK